MAGNETPSPQAAAQPQKPAAAASTPSAKAPAPMPAPLPAKDESKAERAKKAGAEKAKKALGSLKSLGIWAVFSELFKNLLSPDRPSRRMALYFLLSVIGIVGVFALSGVYFKNLRNSSLQAMTGTGEQGKNLGEFMKKQAEEAKKKFSSQSLGTFTIELKRPDANGKTAKRPPGVMDLAEIEIVVDCDEKETCEFLEERMPAVRNEVTGLFTAMNRDDLLSKEGKRHLKERIISKLNLWLPKGKIENLYFNKLVLS